MTNWPSYGSLDQTKLAHARNISCDNAPGKTNLTGFKPATEKPRHRELWQAVMGRDPTNRPKNWSMETCVKWLLDPANKPSPDSAPGGTGPAGPEVAAEDERVRASLQQLLLYDCGLTELPASLGKLRALQKLEVSDNRLARLPDSFAELRALKDLGLFHNQMTILPRWVAQLH